MAEQTTEKLCVICRESCSGQPRVRNSKGEYAHKRCAERSRRPRPVVVEAPPEPTEPDDGLLEGLLDDLPRTDEVSEGPRVMEACPGCGGALLPDAVLCVSCGFDTRSGKALTPKIEKARNPNKGGVREAAVSSGAVYIFGSIVGAGLGAAIGGAVWAVVISQLHFQAGILAILVAALCGIGAAYGAKGNVGFLTGFVALVFTMAAILGGKWYGGVALADQYIDQDLAKFRGLWQSFDDEERGLYVQEDRARDELIRRLERGNHGGINDFNYEVALASSGTYPERFPADVVMETDMWWFDLEAEDQIRVVEQFPSRYEAELEDRREDLHEKGFIATLGIRDLIYVGLAVLVSAGLGSNENTAPFMN